MKSIEDVQRFWDRRPCNVRHSPLPVGTKEYFDEVEARKYFVEPHIPGFAQFGRWRKKAVLEIGCGIGTDTVNFARAGASVVAVDVSLESIRLARKRVAIEGLSHRVKFVNCDAERLTDFVPQHAYDLIYSFGVIHHTPRPSKVLEGARELLSPTGELRAMVYNRHSWKAIEVTKGFLGNTQAIARYSEAQTGCPVTYSYTKRELRCLLEQAGFDTVHLSIEHIFPYLVEEYAQYRYVRRPIFRIMPAGFFSWLEHQLGWHMCVVAKKANP